MDYWHVALMPIDKSRAQHYVFTRGMLVLNTGETDSSHVPMATDGPDVTDEALLARLGLRLHSSLWR
jgi:hypothetical protein